MSEVPEKTLTLLDAHPGKQLVRTSIHKQGIRALTVGRPTVMVRTSKEQFS